MSKQEISTRDRILNAVESLLASHGASGVTLDAVAAEAGVSKGGLLYHFRSKSDLYDGLVARLRAKEQRQMDAAKDGDAIDLFLRASELQHGESANLWALFTTLRGNTDLSERARADIVYIFQAWRDVLTDAVGDPVLAETIRLVGDGLFLSSIAGLPIPDENTVNAIVDRLQPQR
ncbi:TetR/AcrR family transcriptional regulator [Haloglycomyces albus]|uniref:TetR/AcrR family transcriptional regulator n=1 Tax=Haloglycomyces albus TaxID=526067 RepID=UPI00046D2253|nr:TetR/AcrR family transcriptional regulator [Haloglycomyces albus]